MKRRTRATLLLAATAALLALVPASPASAQEAPPAGDVTKDATTMLYNAGIDAAKAEQWEKAYESFQAAFKIKQHPQIAVNLGRAAVKTGRHREAAEALTFFLHETKEQVDNQDRAAVQKLLLEAKGKIGTLLVKVNKPGADVVVDGKVVGQAPLKGEVFVEAGKHTVEARLGKERAEPLTVELKAGDSRQVGLAVGGKSTVEEGGPAAKPEVKDAKAAGGPETWVLIAGGSAAGVGVIMGIASAVAANKEDGIDEQGSELRSEEEAMLSNLSFWSFLGAGLMAGATVTYALVAPRRSTSEGAVRVIPVAGPQFAGLSVSGRW